MLIQKLMYVAETASAVVLYLLIALSVLSIGVIIERWWYFRRRRVDPVELGETLERALRTGGASTAIDELKNSRGVEAEILADALKWESQGAESVEQILSKAVRQRRKQFESGLIFLGTLGNNAPFIGLFGTVLGIMNSFKQLGSSQTPGAMGSVMASIGEALTATAIGILVAIPAVVGFNIFQKKGSDIEENAAALGNIVLAWMRSGAESHGAKGSGERAAKGAREGADEVVRTAAEVSA
jgi:biopolymer transport protein ExbB/biopolymer transport protein TolQ